MLDFITRIFQRYHILSIFASLIALGNITLALGAPFGMIYYALMGGVLFILLLIGGLERINWAYALFIFACALSIIFNDVPAVFQPWTRLVVFIVLMALVSPFLQSSLLRRFRVETFTILLNLQLLVVVISALMPLFGVETTFNGIGNRGITIHLMLFGPIAGMGFIYCLYRLWVQKADPLRGPMRWTFIFLAFLCFAMMISSTSRIAVLSTVGGCVALMVYKARFKAGRTIAYAAALTIAVGVSYPFWSQYSIEVIAKQEAAMRSVGTLGSRTRLWEERIQEFRKSPYIGIGFAAVDGLEDTRSVSAPTRTQGYRFRGMNRHHNQSIIATAIGKDGKVETGSGWLTVLSMTGIIGISIFFYLFFVAFRKTIIMVYRYDAEPFSLLGALLVFFCVHMVAEGYVLAAGSYLFFLMWLIMGVIDASGRHTRVVSLFPRHSPSLSS